MRLGELTCEQLMRMIRTHIRPDIVAYETILKPAEKTYLSALRAMQLEVAQGDTSYIDGMIGQLKIIRKEEHNEV